MLSFDKLKKDWTKVIATNSTEFSKATMQVNYDSEDVNAVHANNDLENKLKYIGKSLEILKHSHPVTLDDKAIYDLAGTERAEIYNQKRLIEKRLENENFSPQTLDFINTVFELGGNVRGYHMALAHQECFEDAQKKQINILKSSETKAINREAYFDIVKIMFDKTIKHAAFSSYNPSLIIERIDSFLKPKIKTKSVIKNTVQYFYEKGLITIKRGTKTTNEKEQAKVLSTYLSNTYKESFFNSTNNLYQSLAETNISLAFDDQFLAPAQDEIKVIDICNTLLNNPVLRAKLFYIPVKSISNGIVKKLTEQSLRNEDREAFLKNKIEDQIRRKFIIYYNTTLHNIPTKANENDFLELYRTAQKERII